MARRKSNIVLDIDQGWKAIGKIKEGSIEVGYFGDMGEILERAVANEYGIGVPQRSFMRSAIDVNKDRIYEFIDKSVGKLIDYNYDTFQFLQLIGQFIRKIIIERINDSRSWALANHEITVALKGSDQPLVETGQMRMAIDFRMV